MFIHLPEMRAEETNSSDVISVLSANIKNLYLSKDDLVTFIAFLTRDYVAKINGEYSFSGFFTDLPSEYRPIFENYDFCISSFSVDGI
jgi:hypothetical protein